MHQNAPFIPLNIKNRLPKEGGTPLLQPPPPRVLRLLVSATPFPPILAKFLSILKLIYIPERYYRIEHAGHKSKSGQSVHFWYFISFVCSTKHQNIARMSEISSISLVH